MKNYISQTRANDVYDIEEEEEYSTDSEEVKETIEATSKINPHKLFRDIIRNPSPKGTYQMTIMGRPIDLSALENYMVFKISPKTITTLMRYNDAKTLAELGFGKRTRIRINWGLIMILIIIVAVVGLLLVVTKGDIAGFFRGLF
ncbi:MAG: hypothetical protein ACTSWZ_02765 [Candidatus Heimdallarchaeaceae archaeon]